MERKNIAEIRMEFIWKQVIHALENLKFIQHVQISVKEKCSKENFNAKKKRFESTEKKNAGKLEFLVERKNIRAVGMELLWCWLNSGHKAGLAAAIDDVVIVDWNFSWIRYFEYCVL